MEKQKETYKILSSVVDNPKSKVTVNLKTEVEIDRDGKISLTGIHPRFDSLESAIEYLRDVANQIEKFNNIVDND